MNYTNPIGIVKIFFDIFYFYRFLYYNLSNLEEIMIFWRLINRRLDNLPLFQGEKHEQDIANGFNPFADNS